MSRRPARRANTRRPAQGRKRAPARRQRKAGALDRALAALPLTQATLQRVAAWSIVGVTALAGLGVAAWFGLPQAGGVAVAEAIGRAGFRVDAIEITGLQRMDRMQVYAQALDQETRAMPLVDLSKVRDRLMQFPWIADARVSRRLPDTLMIHIVEREPAAVWQLDGRLMLIDPTGKELEPVRPDALPDLPRLIGQGANRQEAARARLMEAAPALKPLVTAAAWVGNRRWDLFFDTGEKLQLPEGEAASAAALNKFAQIDGTDRLLGKGYLRFDMRDPAKLVMQRQAPAAAPPKAPAPGAATPKKKEGRDDGQADT